MFHGFGQAKFAYGGSILGSSQFTLLPQLPVKAMVDLKVVKIDSEDKLTQGTQTLHMQSVSRT